MADFVASVLRSAAEKETKYKTIEVLKDIDVEIDEGNLLVSDTNPFDLTKFRTDKEDFFKNLARDNTQLLINRIWQLPTEKADDVIVAKLPDPKTKIPREKPIPKAKHVTRWEHYARLKGIANRKKGRMEWDEQAKEWRPRWGYKRANDETKDWFIEIPDNADPYEDQFEKRKKEKKERTAKNELQRLRNIARSQKMKVPGVGLTPTENPSKEQLGKALVMAKKSTASIGKFTEALPKEKTSKYGGKKRKFESNYGDIKKETSKQLEILKNLHSDQPAVDVNKASNLVLSQEDARRAKWKKENPFGPKKTGKRSKMGGRGYYKGGGQAKKGRGGGGGNMKGGR
ncbi:hypothetical protein ACJMK2_035306 [Sinanodonta woodiana]|uniref:Ribosome biogenesis regulatory protein n=1 Tax=Sinanodonta woodiana TaxID=1069815 RepID=A0ABD3WW99_SINWO